jgi:hypothetical protein
MSLPDHQADAVIVVLSSRDKKQKDNSSSGMLHGVPSPSVSLH